MRRLLILCNALDDFTRSERSITTDSPAGSRKVFLMARALRRAGLAATIISLGRGRRSGGGERFAAVARRPFGVPTLYLAFNNRPILSELGSLVAAGLAMVRLVRRRQPTVLLVYNRALAYVPAMLVARLVGVRVVLDLEDGFSGTRGVRRLLAHTIGNRLFDALCSDRALLACSALAAATRLRPTMLYYGVSEQVAAAPRLADDGRIVALLGGTVDADTGGELLADTVEHLRRGGTAWVEELHIEVTGKGGSIARLTALAAQDGCPTIRVWGRTTDAEYAAISARADVGLSLKLNAGNLAHTTFPSKTIELAAAGNLLLSSDISDVRGVFGDDGAVYITRDTVDELAARLRWIVEHRAVAHAVAVRGIAAAVAATDPARAGRRLADFLWATDNGR